ncbi:MAG TPA: glycosyltransferase family 2 protein [Spirochaetota bacterium]|nr:glycosyltransferase family 2 protein [Spirochaetota bacterium]
MKLIIQVPCYNEAATLPEMLKHLPRKVAGFKKVEWLVIDDGSGDGTAECARKHAVDHVVSFTRNMGLARAFMAGIDACLHLGADVIVNTDADNQYDARDIPALTRPILERRAEIVVGARPIDEIAHFSFVKKALQRIGSAVVRLLSRTDIPDAPSGFRAFSRDAAMRLHVFGDYTYTLETIIQAGQQNMNIISVPVRVNEDLRESRLVKSVPRYVFKSFQSIVRIFIVYRPFRFFMSLGLLLFGAGFLVGARFLWFYLTGSGEGHIQSLILAAVLLMIGFLAMLSAFIVDLLATNRKLSEDVLYRVRKIECVKGNR